MILSVFRRPNLALAVALSGFGYPDVVSAVILFSPSRGVSNEVLSGRGKVKTTDGTGKVADTHNSTE